MPGLEREKVAEPLEPEGLVDPFPNRRGAHRLLLRAEAPAELGYLGRAHAEQLGGEGHQPVLVGAEGAAVAERDGPHPLHQLQALGPAEALSESAGVVGETGSPLLLGRAAPVGEPPAERPQRSRR